MRRLVILAPNWLGDAIMSLPAIADVRRGLPDATIAVAARGGVSPLFELAGVDECLTLGSSWTEDARTLRNGQFEAALLLPNSIRSALVAARAAIPERWGYGTDLRRPLLTRAVPRARQLHQVAYYQQLVGRLGFDNGPDEPRITVPPGARAAADALLSSRGRKSGSLVAIAPGAAFGGAKRWPPERFASLVDALAGDGVQSVLVGARADRPSAEAVVACLRAASRESVPIDLVGGTTLAELAGVLAACRTLVTNDSGAMHMAAAVGTPVTAVFGPTNERETRPLGPRHTVITGDAWCRPCMLRECPLDHRCMRGVDADTVMTAARRTL